MTSVKWQTIFDSFYAKAQAYDLTELSEYNATEFMREWLHSAVSKPFVRRLFSTITIDDEIQTISYELNYEVDEDTDTGFIVDILGFGMIAAWLEPQVNSIMNTSQIYASKEEKFYSQANHLAEIKSLLASVERKQRNLISDRTSFWNSYLGAVT